MSDLQSMEHENAINRYINEVNLLLTQLGWSETEIELFKNVLDIAKVISLSTMSIEATIMKLQANVKNRQNPDSPIL